MQYCLVDSDCKLFLDICLSNQCIHKPLFPLSFLDILMLFLVFISSIITTVAGVGGGIFFFPILVGVSSFLPTPGVAISLSIVMFLMIIRYLMSYKERHPLQNRSLINYEMSIILCPSSIVGTIFGVLINSTAPNWFILILILISLGISIIETWKKAVEQRKKEVFSENSKIKTEENNEISIPLKTKEENNINPNINLNNTSFQRLIEEENKPIPKKKLLILFINLIILTIILFMRGSKTIDSIIGLPYCGLGFWIFVFLYIPFGGVILYYSVNMLNKEYQIKSSSGYSFLKSDIKWDEKNIKKSLILGFLIGFTSSILGVGGSIITSPALINFGFDAREATYTGTFIAMLTSFTGAIQYLFAGVVQFDYFGACLFVGLIGLWIGMNYILEYVKNKNRNSIIMFTLVGCVVMAVILIIVPGINRSVEEYREDKLFSLRNFC